MYLDSKFLLEKISYLEISFLMEITANLKLSNSNIVYFHHCWGHFDSSVNENKIKPFRQKTIWKMVLTDIIILNF